MIIIILMFIPIKIFVPYPFSEGKNHHPSFCLCFTNHTITMRIDPYLTSIWHHYQTFHHYRVNSNTNLTFITNKMRSQCLNRVFPQNHNHNIITSNPPYPNHPSIQTTLHNKIIRWALTDEQLLV